jgi:hypothetical protein
MKLPFNFCQSRRRVKHQKRYARWKVVMISFADMFVQKAKFLSKTFTPETRVVVIYIRLEVTH